MRLLTADASTWINTMTMANRCRHRRRVSTVPASRGRYVATFRLIHSFDYSHLYGRIITKRLWRIMRWYLMSITKSIIGFNQPQFLCYCSIILRFVTNPQRLINLFFCLNQSVSVFFFTYSSIRRFRIRRKSRKFKMLLNWYDSFIMSYSVRYQFFKTGDYLLMSMIN